MSSKSQHTLGKRCLERGRTCDSSLNGRNFYQDYRAMTYTRRFGQSDDYRREELIRVIEHSVEKLTLQELEALYYDMSTKNYINEQY